MKTCIWLLMALYCIPVSMHGAQATKTNPGKINPAFDLPLFSAIHCNNPEQVLALLMHSANPNACNKNGVSMLMEATLRGYAPIVRILLEGGANIHERSKEDQKTALGIAVTRNHPNVVQVLLEYHADVNAKYISRWINDWGEYKQAERTPAIDAAARGHTEILQMLVEAKANIKEVGSENKSVIDFASTNPLLKQIVLDFLKRKISA